MARTNTRALRFAEAAFAVARDSNSWTPGSGLSSRRPRSVRQSRCRAVSDQPGRAGREEAGGAPELLPGISVEVQRFLGILAHRDRLELVPEIAQSFRAAAQRASGHRGGAGHHGGSDRRPAEGGDRLQARAAARQNRHAGRRGSIRRSSAGVIAQVGDNVIDGSVRGRLERLRRTLTA